MIGKYWDKLGHRVITHPAAQPFHHSARNQSVSTGNKSYLPSKDCVTCGRPFSWRKKWERSWDEVKYCSARCRKDKPNAR
nr:DUF2256 domain-containing protein [Algimonas ampicilliniresistens]